MERKTKKVLGFDVDLIGFSDAVDFVMNKILHNEGLHIVTINPEIIEMANSNLDYRKIVKNADLVIPDGVGIKIALKLKGIEQIQIPGIELAYELISSCSDMNYPVALIGAKEEVIVKTVERLQAEFENLNICYKRNGYFTKEKESEIINELVNTEPKLVLIALGAPKQEFFIKKCRELYPNAVYIGVGGSFDVWSGEVERAPRMFRLIGCEWLYRVCKQPQRLKRIYKILPLFLIKAIIEAIKSRIILLKGKTND